MFERLEGLIGINNVEKLHNTKILLVGVGGVGGYALETLVRNGIEDIIIIDKDKVDITNKNRQIIALDSTISKYKCDAFKERILDINNKCNVTVINEFLDVSNIDEVFKLDFDYVIDCCDTVDTKILLIKYAKKYNKKIISSMGMGKKLDTKKVEITTLKKTSYDPLAKVIRKRLRDENIDDNIIVVSSTEEAKKGDIIYSYSPVTNYAGILIADYIIKDIIKED
ncbi:MAG: ThiF family adenylyltransferase [Bacilli bacterium]|nr:ThiF family adenylyltransferase [Bacilli bacterium]